MTHEEREKRIEGLLEEAARLRFVKRRDYSPTEDVMANLAEDGPYGCIVRIGDKRKRLKTFCLRGKFAVPEEKAVDDCLDIVNLVLFAALLIIDEGHPLLEVKTNFVVQDNEKFNNDG